MGQDQRDVWNTYEQQASDNDADARRRRKADEKFLKDHPEAIDRRAAIWFTAIVVVALLLLWGHYGPIVRDAIYGVAN